MYPHQSSLQIDRNRLERSTLHRTGLALAVCALLVPAAATAQENTAARKAGRGIAGMTLGFLEIPGNVVQESRSNGIVSGMTIGLALGAGKLVARELIGVYEFVTAPFAVPAGFEPILQPEFSWGYFESEPGRAYGFTDTYLSEEAYQLDRISGAVIERRAGALVVRFPEDMLFAIDSAELSRSATARLREIACVIRENPDAQVVVAGYTDSTGDSLYNQELSRKRADAVRSYLLRQGIGASERIEIAARGDERPVASNDTPLGRMSNRRVEIELRASGVGAYR
jgi:putative exosortase-associated protein (TIGR04073 family)